MKKLMKCIDAVNRRYQSGLNDDDQVARMVMQDKKTIGHSFWPEWDTYVLIADQEKYDRIRNKFGQNSSQLNQFKQIIIDKGGITYLSSIEGK